MNGTDSPTRRLANLPQYVCCSRPRTFRGRTRREEEFLLAVVRSLRRLGARETTTTSSSHVGISLEGYLVILDADHAPQVLPQVNLERCLVVVIGNLDELCRGPRVPQIEVHGTLAAFAATADLAGTELCASEWFIEELFRHLYDGD